MKKNVEIRNSWFAEKVSMLEVSGLTQAEIAMKLKVKPQYLNNILHGKGKSKRNATENIIDKLCESFKINQNDLLVLMTDSISEKTHKEKHYPEPECKVDIVTEQNSSESPPNNECKMCKAKDETIAALKAQIATQAEYIECLKEQSPQIDGQKRKIP